jgi:hypothetical protein
MGRHLGLVLFSLTGCSLIYNPGELPDKGAEPPDAAIADANPALLKITEVKSPPLLEGAGQDGSSPAVLVLYGNHITQGATVEIAPTTPNPSVIISTANISVAEDGNSLACLVTAAYMDTVGAGELPLTVTVSEPGASPVTTDWKLRALDELTTAGMQAVPMANKVFSRVDVAGDLIFPPKSPSSPDPVVIRAVGRIAISGVVRANANGKAAGAGGCGGGNAQQPGECFGGGGGGGAGVLGPGGGGGGGFAEKGGNGLEGGVGVGAGAGGAGGAISGDPLLHTFNVNRGGGGGAGGGGNSGGGGGGGAIEITAGGTLVVGTVEAVGATGINGGGGGAGGSVVLRAGATLTLPSNVNVGAGNGAGNGGNGSVGRWRYDANGVAGTASTNPAPKRGPMIAKPTNPIFETKTPELVVNADPGGSGASVSLVVKFPDGTTDTKNVNLTGPTSTVVPGLAIGLNEVCVVIAGGNYGSPEARNCIDVAFVP